MRGHFRLDGQPWTVRGICGAAGCASPQAILWQILPEFILLEEDDIRLGMVWMIERAHTLAEAAGDASLAAAYRMRHELKDKRVGIVCCRRNVSLQHLREALITVVAECRRLDFGIWRLGHGEG